MYYFIEGRCSNLRNIGSTILSFEGIFMLEELVLPDKDPLNGYSGGN